MELLDWLKQTSEYATGGVFIFAEEPLSVVFCNEAACEQPGYDWRELSDNPPNTFFGTAPEREFKPTIGSALMGNQAVTKRLQNYRKGGRPYLTDLALYPIPCNTDHMRYWIGCKDDLSRIESAELRLATAQIKAGLFQKRLWNAIEALPDAFVVYDKDDCLVACNDRYKEFYSASADAIFPGANFHDIVCFGVNCVQYPEAVGREEEWLDEWRERPRKPIQPIERELSGERFIILHDVVTDNGDLVGLQTDVTELRKHKAQLEEQMKFVELLLTRNPAIVLSQGSDWKIQTCSNAWTQQFRYSREETVGCDLTEFMSAEDAEMSKAFREGALKPTGAPPIIKTVLTFLTKEGERRSVELQPITENEDAGWRNTIAMTDITPTVRARDKLERLAANDELTGLRSRRGHRRRFSDGKMIHRKTSKPKFCEPATLIERVN
ncbi:MAG: PAS domain-containing protein [Pseudomonadota bacterium]